MGFITLANLDSGKQLLLEVPHRTELFGIA